VSHTNIVVNAFRMLFGVLAHLLYGCSHRRTTFPITLRNGVRLVHGLQIKQSETYTVCLQCGRHFAYDWNAMRTIRQRPVWAACNRVRIALA